MNISVKGEYALQAIFDLAANSGPQSANSDTERAAPVKIADIARRQKIPQKFLELILASLKQGGFVESRRGADGGYLLARRPESISVGEVLRFIEGRQEERARQRRQSDSPFCDVWDRADRAIDTVLDSANFAQLVREWTERHSRFVPNWEI